MVLTPTTVSVSPRRAAFGVVSAAMLVALLLPADAAAQGRARLSDDLKARLRAGDTVDGSVIVTATQERIEALAARHGLRIRKRLQTGAVLDVPAGALEAIARDAEVDQLSGNHRLHAQMTVTTAAIGADQAWAGIGELPGVNGQGVGVAIIDSGIAPVPELRDRIVASVDFTDERGRGLDRFGHGTHVAGIVAAARARRDNASGVAPAAHLVSLKVLDEAGLGTAADVIEAIDWAVANRRRYRLRVINMSLGGTPMQSWRDDPLCQAVQRAHEAGLVVVASAGNKGKLPDGTPVLGGITVPGTCPHSITVGALNTKGTAFRSDDEVATYSSKGPTRFDRLIKPDLVAPGNKIVSLLAPGSTLARDYPELVIGSGRDARLQLSGTSMAAAAVSGAAALLIDGVRHMTPNITRAALQYGAERDAELALVAGGAGSLNVAASLQLARGPRPTVSTTIGGETATAGGLLFAHTVVWGNSDDTVVWGNNWDTVVWGNSHDTVVWGNSETVVWGNSETVVWGNAETVVWGNTETVVWGNSYDTVVWGNSYEDTVVWGNYDDTVVWGNSDDTVVWGNYDDTVVWGN